jgi:hypothetical protein
MIIKTFSLFSAPFALWHRLRVQMRKLMKNSKAVLSAISLILLSYAGADAGLSGIERHNLDLLSPSSNAVSGHSALHRASFRNRKFSQGHTTDSLAATPVVFVRSLSFAGFTDCPDVSSHDLSCPRATSARAPPLS